MNHWVMDYETLSNCFLGVFEHYKTNEVHVFTINKLRNDLDKLLKFFNNNIKYNEWHISFNGLAFDAQITMFILKNYNRFKQMNGESIAREIYSESQEIIKKSNNHEFQKYQEYKIPIKQIDVYKLNHWDNPAKRASLKWIECSMDWPNVQDMPIDHRTSITTVDQLKQIASYCRNDVSSTKEIMKKSSKQIMLRKTLTDQYNIRLYSASEPRISKELFLHFLSKKTGISKYELKHLRTYRTHIYIKDIILPYIKFDVPVFQDLLYKFQNLVINPNMTKNSFKYLITYRGLTSKFGLGGIHGAKKGLYQQDEVMIIMTSDVVSYYPNLAIRNKWSPAHLPNNDFCELYESFFDERRKIPKSNPWNYVYKIILNSTFGLSNDKNSFLYDPEFTMKVTINGQLLLVMLYLNIIENIPGSVPLMQNTDGVEIMIPKRYKQKYLDICKQWEDLTKLKLDHDEYQKLIIPDVNNYIGIFKNKEVTKKEFYTLQKESPDYLFNKKNNKYYIAKTKSKGRFVFNDRPLHKNKSFTVISKAIYYYFVHGISPEDYIKTNKNIFDYCGQTRARGEWKFKTISIQNGQVVYKKVQKTMRYYISNKGCKILKYNIQDGREINVEAGPWVQTIFNDYIAIPFDKYNIDYRFYLSKIKKEIMSLKPEIFSTQIKLNF